MQLLLFNILIWNSVVWYWRSIPARWFRAGNGAAGVTSAAETAGQNGYCMVANNLDHAYFCQHLQLAVNPWRIPADVGVRHHPDKFAHPQVRWVNARLGGNGTCRSSTVESPCGASAPGFRVAGGRGLRSRPSSVDRTGKAIVLMPGPWGSRRKKNQRS
jgi:hypothetical protein